jgi:hypothetical protein
MLVTADGGFDFSEDYCSQEQQATPLILAEFITALYCLSPGGSLILKVFDVVTLPMIQLLWVCSKCFIDFKLVKPKTSRVCNSEKYIVAKGFKGMNHNIQKFITKNEEKLITKSSILTLFEKGPLVDFKTMDPAFCNSYFQCVGKLMKSQIENIKYALTINPEESEASRKYRQDKYIKYAREWCLKYEIPIKSYFFKIYDLP